MAFSKAERRSLVGQIVTNSEFSEEALDQLTDNQLVALAEPDQLDKLVNNAAMPPQLKKAMEAKKKKQAAMNEDMEEEDDMEEDDMEEDEPAPPKKPMTAMKKGYGKKMSTNQWMAAAPPELRRLVANAQQIEAERRTKLVEVITANGNCPVSAEDLLVKSLDDLELMASLVSSPSQPFSYLGAAGAPTLTGNSRTKVDPLPMPGADYMKP